jgi:hypothetical protein
VLAGGAQRVVDQQGDDAVDVCTGGSADLHVADYVAAVKCAVQNYALVLIG